MKTTVAALLFSLGLASAALAADKTYQVTGPVLEVSDSAITVQKGKEKWTLGRDKDTKVTGDLKVGSKVTIEYTMKAVTVEAKDAKPAKGEKADKAAAAAPAAPAAAAPAKK